MSCEVLLWKMSSASQVSPQGKKHHRNVLNNYLQARYRRQNMVTWEVVRHGPLHNCVWVATAHIDGVPYGLHSAGNIREAKEEAARQALVALREDEPTEEH